MCEYCIDPDKKTILLEIRNVHINPEIKYTNAIASLTKALGYDSERQQKEISPFKSVRDLELLSKKTVERKLLKLYTALLKWFDVSKAQDDPFVLNNRIFINPSSGKPLTKKQWSVIKREITGAFRYIYANEEERIVNHALALGKLIKGMSIQDSIDRGYMSLKEQVADTVKTMTGPLWKNTIAFADAHAGELIVDLTQRHYKQIHDVLSTAIKNRASHGELKEKLFDTFGNMNRDWRRIAETEIGTSQNNGQLITELDRSKEGETVFMRGISSSEACPFCRNHVNSKVVVLLDAPPEAGGDQITINGTVYTAIWPGKDNYGRNRANWWVSAGTQHPHCRCTWVKYVPGFEDIEAKFRASMESAMKKGEALQKPIDNPEKLIKPTPWN